VISFLAFEIQTLARKDRDLSPYAKALDLLFVLNRLVRMKLLPEFVIMNGQKIMCLKADNIP
jgi:hypothetical protein